MSTWGMIVNLRDTERKTENVALCYIAFPRRKDI